MKKIMFAFWVLLFVSCIAMAETDKEILFRGIPWGTEYPTVVNTLLNEGIKIREKMNMTTRTKLVKEIIEGGIDYANVFYGGGSENKNTIVSRAYPSANVVIGGNRVDCIILYFANSLNSENEITSEEEYSKLFMACYEFNNMDVPSFTKEMIAKLTYLYGDVSDKKIIYQGLDSKYIDKPKNENYIVYNSYIWHGTNDSLVILQTSDSKVLKSTNTVNILYAWAGIDSLKTEYDNMYLTQLFSDSNELDGL